jgi:broad specificity phosphatase PhoE
MWLTRKKATEPFMHIDEDGRRKAIDGASRRRIYLFRHGSVDYVDDKGNIVPDTDLVVLSALGRSQASQMRDLFASVHIDKALCSGLLRTRETGEAVLGDRDIALEVNAGFVEIRQMKGEAPVDFDILTDVAFSHWRATDDDARFLGGERYSDFYSRIEQSIHELLADDSWHNLALFAHGATNSAFLGWATGLGRSAFGALDQAMCCLNVIDVDSDASGRILRKTVRAMNVTADDPAKGDRHGGDMESLAYWMMQGRRKQ